LCLVPVFLSSVSVSYSYPSCHLCLPLCVSSLFISQLLAVRSATASPVPALRILIAPEANQWLYSLYLQKSYHTCLFFSENLWF
jgi:hypothetical protein